MNICTAHHLKQTVRIAVFYRCTVISTVVRTGLHSEQTLCLSAVTPARLSFPDILYTDILFMSVYNFFFLSILYHTLFTPFEWPCSQHIAVSPCYLPCTACGRSPLHQLVGVKLLASPLLLMLPCVRACVRARAPERTLDYRALHPSPCCISPL